LSSLDEFAARKLAALEHRHLRRILVETDRTDGLWVVRQGLRLLSFSCNDYLNLTHHPALWSPHSGAKAIHRTLFCW